MSIRRVMTMAGVLLAVGGWILLPNPYRPGADAQSAGAAGPVTIAIDAAAARHPISPLIYGTSFATTAQLMDLNLPLNRAGGNGASLYNWRIDARNSGSDWYFESTAADGDVMNQYGTRFVALTRAGGAQPMLTVPMIGWAAKLGPDRRSLASFSITKYGLQEKTDRAGLAEAGNGKAIDGTPITRNDPNDAATPAPPGEQSEWVRQLVAQWGTAARGGVPFYILDNEPSWWHDTHRDVHPVGAHASEVADRTIALSQAIRAADPTARIVAPEEWGWLGYKDSGFDQQQASRGVKTGLDRQTQTGGLDYLPWLLTRWKAAGRPVDVVSVHYYPQGGEYADAGNVSPEMTRLRARSTRSLWDPTYTDTSWIADKVALIPRLKGWVAHYYHPGTPVAITEYNWGADGDMGGATAQADVLGIFGREGLDIANRWATPKTGSPTYLAMKLYRNADGQGHGFGETSVAAQAPDPDTVAAFAALRRDGAMTVMVVAKQIEGARPMTLSLAGFAGAGSVEAVRLVGGRLQPLAARAYTGGRLADVLPPQSVTLYILRGGAAPRG